MLRTARIMVTKDCARGCSYCCNTPDNPAMEGCTTVHSLAEIPNQYDAYVITGGEPLDTERLLARTSSVVATLYKRRMPIYLSTARWRSGAYLLLNKLSGITYTVHSPVHPADALRLRVLEDSIQRMWVLHKRPFSARLVINSEIRHDITWSFGVWDQILTKTFNPDGMCPLAEGEDLYYLSEEE